MLMYKQEYAHAPNLNTVLMVEKVLSEMNEQQNPLSDKALYDDLTLLAD